MFEFEAWEGTLGPAPGTPDRPRGSIRRTTSIDMVWPNGIDGELTLEGRGRDLVTLPDGSSVVADRATLTVVTAGPGRAVAAIVTDPPIDGIGRLVGVPVVAGFRKALGERLAMVAADGSLAALLLDDLTGAAIVSGSATIRVSIEAGRQWPVPPRDPAAPDEAWPRRIRIGGPGPAVCIGHIAGGFMSRRTAEGRPLLGQGPPVPCLTRDDDPLAWHSEPDLGPRSMRRRRRIDIARQDGDLVVDTHFRDSFIEPDGVETAVHEYEVTARLDPATHIVAHVEVRPRSLPGPECSGAAASAQRIVGEPIAAVRDVVRTELKGDTTCTHLNDQLRSLADVPALWASCTRELAQN